MEPGEDLRNTEPITIPLMMHGHMAGTHIATRVLNTHSLLKQVIILLPLDLKSGGISQG